MFHTLDVSDYLVSTVSFFGFILYSRCFISSYFVHCLASFLTTVYRRYVLIDLFLSVIGFVSYSCHFMSSYCLYCLASFHTIDVTYCPFLYIVWLRFIHSQFHVILLFILFGFILHTRHFILSYFVYCLASFCTLAVSYHPILYIVWINFVLSPFHIILFCIFFGFVSYSRCFISSYFLYCLASFRTLAVSYHPLLYIVWLCLLLPTLRIVVLLLCFASFRNLHVSYHSSKGLLFQCGYLQFHVCSSFKILHQ